MKFSVLVIVLSLCLFQTQCRQSAGVDNTEADATQKSEHIWWCEPDSSCQWAITLKKRPKADEYKDSITAIITSLNTEAKKIHISLSLIKTNNDTVFIKVNNSEILTQQLGTTGANTYIGAVTYSLTGGRYKYVNWDFEEGDHAVPGTKTRESIKKEALFCIEE